MSSATVTTSSNKQILILDVSLKVTNKDFDKELYNKNSFQFIEMKNYVEDKITSAYNETDNFLSVTITGFRSGSIVCDGRLYFKNASKSDIPNFNKILSEFGARNGFTVSKFVVNSADDDEDDDEVILGLDWWQIGIIIAGIVVFILIITVVVLCVSI